MNENKKSRIWVYAVILFTSAFVILLLTAYSQIKLNKNLSNYKSQVSSKETENKKVQQNFSSAQEMNAKLNEEIKKLQEENNALQENISSLEYEKARVEEADKTRNEAEESLANAINVYLSGNVLECAKLVESINYVYLEGNVTETYKTFSAKVMSEAGKILLDEGYSSYMRAEYSIAASKLSTAYQYAPAVSYSDKCLFYLARSELKLDDKPSALVHMNMLIYNYPDSKYIRSAKRFVEKYQG